MDEAFDFLADFDKEDDGFLPGFGYIEDWCN